MHVQSCCFANLNLLQPRSQGSVRESLGTRLNLLLFFVVPRCRRRSRCLSSLFYYVGTGTRLLVSLVGTSS